jgi:hypothetical protein
MVWPQIGAPATLANFTQVKLETPPPPPASRLFFSTPLRTPPPLPSALLQNGFKTVIAIDFPGHGRSHHHHSKRLAARGFRSPPPQHTRTPFRSTDTHTHNTSQGWRPRFGRSEGALLHPFLARFRSPNLLHNLYEMRRHSVWWTSVQFRRVGAQRRSFVHTSAIKLMQSSALIMSS